MAYPPNVDSGPGDLTIGKGNSLYIVDSNGIVNQVLFMNNFNNVTFKASTNNVFVFRDNAGNGLCFFDGGLGGIEIAQNKALYALDGNTVTDGKILSVDGPGNTILQAHVSGVVEIADTSGNVAWSTKQSSSAASLSNGSTITATGIGGARVTASGNVTGIILQAGVTPTQEVVVYNESAFTITFAAAGTSNVADGTSAVIAANRSMFFSWNSAQNKWYHS